MSDYALCVNNFKSFKEGRIYKVYGVDYSKEIEFNVGPNKPYIKIDRKDYDKNFIIIRGFYIFPITKHKFLNRLKEFLTLEDPNYISFSSLRLENLHRLYSKVLLYMYKVEDKELFIPFIKTMRYSLDTLSKLSEFEDEIDYKKEIDRIGGLFKAIYEFVDPLQNKVNNKNKKFISEQVNDILNKHNKVIEDSRIAIQEITKY